MLSPTGRRFVVRDMGKSYNFQATSFLKSPSISSLSVNTREFTICGYFRTKVQVAGSVSGYKTWFGIENSGGTYQVGNYGNTGADKGKIYCAAIAGFAGAGSITGAGSPSPDLMDCKWHFLAMSCSFLSNEVKLYVDGELIGTSTWAVASSNIDYVCFNSRYYDANRSMDAIGTHYKLFNKALSQTELRDMYYNNIIPSGLALSYELNDTTGTVATDTSGNGKNGTITPGAGFWEVEVPMKSRSSI